MRHLLRSLIALALLAGGAIGHCPTAHGSTIGVTSVWQSATQVGLYEPLTIRFGLTKTYSNPYDPDAIDVRFEFIGPSGTVRVIPAFYSGETPAWQARIVPLEVGLHNCRILANDSSGDAGAHPLTFTATASAAKGFIRIDSRNPRYLRFDNGTPYCPVGHNVCWYGRHSEFYDWLDNMAQAGENWTRYWMVAYVGQDIEWGGGTSYQLGRYSQSNARLFDQMLEAVRARGIHVQLCLDSYNGWNESVWPNWNENVYNVANGGMCSRPNDFFINSEAMRYARRRFRYIVARWAYNPAILCWEFFNEVDAVGGGGATFWGHEAEVAAWHQAMAQYIRSIDPFQHLRSTSFADDGPRSSYSVFWQLPEMEIVQVHQYSILLPQEHVSLIRAVRQFGKPVIMGEGAASGDPQTLDSSGTSLHDMIWPAAVIESGAMSWWWDSWIHPRNLYYRFEPLVAFLQGEDWAPQNLAPLSCTILSGHTTPEIYGSSGPAHAYVYIRNWQGTVSGLRLRLNQITGTGQYGVEYWDTNTESPFATQTASGASGGLVLNIPDFARDVAIKVKVQGPDLQVAPHTLSFIGFAGHPVDDQPFTITNAGFGTGWYQITDDADWLSLDPAGGDVTQETDTMTVSCNTDGLALGTHSATITVLNPSNSSVWATVAVTLVVKPQPGDLDIDGDVDQSDFGLLQACFSGAGVLVGPDCAAASLDADGDVDRDDATVFLNCMTGPGVPGDPDCLN